MHYNINESQDLFWSFVHIILEIASLDTLLLCYAGQQPWLCSWFVLKFFAKTKAFVLKILMQECNLVRRICIVVKFFIANVYFMLFVYIFFLTSASSHQREAPLFTIKWKLAYRGKVFIGNISLIEKYLDLFGFGEALAVQL